MAEFGPGAGPSPLPHKNKGVLAGQLRGSKWVENTDARDQWAAKYGPRTTRDCPADGDCPIGSHVHDPSGAVHLVDAGGRWALKPLGQDGAP